MSAKYSINDVVYLAESAKIGRIESFKVVEIRQRPDSVWYYKFGVPARPPTSLATIGDRITKKSSYDFELAEEELCTLCEGIAIAKSYLEGELAKISALESQYCSGTGSS